MIKRLIASMVCVLGLSACASVPSSQHENLSIYLLMGQSNMSGRGDIAALPEAYRTPDPRLWLYGNDGVWKPALEPLDDATGQVDAVSSDAGKAGVGAGLAFARALKTRRAIGLVPCAKGGSSAAQWTPDEARTTLYGSCLARVREVAPKGRVVGVLWYQGETDAGSDETARLWTGRMTTLISRFRSDLGAPCLPWVVVGLADAPDPQVWKSPMPAWAEIQAQQVRLPEALSRVIHISAVGSAKNADTLHLSTEAQLAFGARLAEAMTTVSRQPCR